jgi:mycofactocin glycosyltransferase
MRRYMLDASVRRADDGRLLSGGVPSRLVRLTATGSAVLDDALAGRPVADGAPRRLVQRLDDQGLIHPCGAGERSLDVTTVIPVCNAPAGLPALIRALRERGGVIVVDDGSTDDAVEVARAAGATVLSNAGPPGPSAARNTGIAAARTELVALVDADVVLQPGWHDALLGLFDDPSVAVAAPVVESLPGRSAVARYEAVYSPLELGGRAAVVGPWRRLAYVPSAALVARRSALDAVGGFDPALLIGEDIDLVWRLVERGWKVRYTPDARVLHEPRGSVRALALQRFIYGRSAVVLEGRHPGSASPLRVTAPTVGIWAAALLAGPAGAAVALAASVAAEASDQPEWESRRALARILVLGHLRSARHLARVATREWLPLTAGAFVLSPRWRRWGAIAFAIDLVASRNHLGQARDVPVQVAVRVVDHVAYAAGLWRGMVEARSFGAAVVRVGGRAGPSG